MAERIKDLIDDAGPLLVVPAIIAAFVVVYLGGVWLLGGFQ